MTIKLTSLTEMKKFKKDMKHAYKMTKRFSFDITYNGSNGSKSDINQSFNIIIKLGKSISDMDTILKQVKQITYLASETDNPKLLSVERQYLVSLIKAWNETNPNEQLSI